MTLGDFTDYLVWMSFYELSDFSGSHRWGEKEKQEERRKKEKIEGEEAGGGGGEGGNEIPFAS